MSAVYRDAIAAAQAATARVAANKNKHLFCISRALYYLCRYDRGCYKG